MPTWLIIRPNPHQPIQSPLAIRSSISVFRPRTHHIPQQPALHPIQLPSKRYPEPFLRITNPEVYYRNPALLKETARRNAEVLLDWARRRRHVLFSPSASTSTEEGEEKMRLTRKRSWGAGRWDGDGMSGSGGAMGGRIKGRTT